MANTNKAIIVCVSLFVCNLCIVPIQGDEEKKSLLCQGNYQTEEQAKAQLEQFLQSYPSLGQWQAKAERIREGILRGAELLPLPQKCDLKPIIHSKREYDGYTVENAAFESLPGVFVTGNLYRPR
ncbi:MAG: hypothetical protein JXM79_17885, partial [Sedimentisphaerales bacterium]|nr:hypothetical protein [Sedimentisphaerales bacterium]